MNYDDALHDEREEQAAERHSAPYPPGRMVAGYWHDDAPTDAEAEADARG